MQNNNAINCVRDDYRAESKNLKNIYWVYLNFSFVNTEIKDSLDNIVNNAFNCFTGLEQAIIRDKQANKNTAETNWVKRQ